ncbi:hypothetical protein M8C21_015373 [Ambrosia artemisiifolia]|uniref:Uncharacterized protein n=1 Tax=Ambrosia artemisiifolia TaxID=4212 RepID=A0AAD5G8B8_AMBAR|nr:hypothetical protein M8C21_015373 [Ambrosia artemisiifolia]
MAAANSVFMATPVARLTTTPSSRKTVNFSVVRCMSQDQQPSATTPPPSAPKVSTKFSDVLAFSGPAPERINGRLAMIGFVSALAVELVKQRPRCLLSDLSRRRSGVSSHECGAVAGVVELWNGRAAMLGLVALAFTEYVTGSALV